MTFISGGGNKYHIYIPGKQISHYPVSHLHTGKTNHDIYIAGKQISHLHRKNKS